MEWGDRCPEDETFVTFTEGRLATPAAASFHNHIDACERCRRVLAMLSSGTDAPGTAPLAAGTYRVDTFVAGDLVANRYRIAHLIARGGMGEVYDAEDLTLRTHVALKTVRTEMARAQLVERLKRELYLARRVTHPNVCRLFDVGIHRGRAGESVAFLTMELLAGETLARKSTRVGPFPFAEAAPIVRQMTQGLAAIHAARIIHRDFKPENVFLVPAPGADGVRVVVTDFGLARAIDERDPFGVTIEGAVVGTPRYMAPEQVAGGELTPATDLYALGAVIHQMMTGAHPFEGSTLAERFRHDPPSVRARRPDLPVAWDRAIARLLALDPAERFQCCEDLMNALDVERPARASTRVPPVGSNRSKLRAIGVALLGLFIAGALFAGTKSWHRQSVPVARNAVGARLCVAVLGFRNLGGNAESDWLSTAFSEAIRAELAGGGQLRLLSGEDVARMKRELALPESDSLSREALVHVRRDLDADVLVLGSYLVIGASGSGRVRLDLEIQDTRNGETVASQVINGTEPAFMDVVAEAGRRLRGALGVAGITDEEEKAVRAALPLDLHALRLYAEGLVRLRACNPPGAHEQLEKAALIDPGNPMIHAALAEALASMGETDRARAEAEKAFARATSMSREERIVIEARYRRLAEEWEDAIRLYRTLFQSFPDNPSYGLALAEVQTAARKPKDVEVTLEKLRRLPGAVEDPRIDLAAAGATEDGQTARIMLAGAARKAEARGAKALVARARASEASVLFQLGEYKEAIAIGEAAGNLADAAGERQSRLMALTALSNAASAFGELKYAAAVQDEVLALLTSLGRKRQAAMAAIDAARLYLRSGNLMAAAQRAREAERLTRESPARGSIGTVLVSEAEIELAAGRLPEARKHAEDAIEAFRGIDDDLHNAWAWSVLGEVLTEQGDFAEARKRLEQSLAWRERMDRKVFAAESRLALAKLAFDEGDPIAAKPFARDALVAFRDGKADDGAALAAAVLARALVTREPDQALRIVEEAAHASAASENPRSRFALTLANALVRDAMQHRATLSAGGTASPTGHDNVTEPMFDDVVVPAPLVVEPLNVVIDEAHRLGLLRDEWDARLAIAIVEIRDGRNAAAAGRARAVEADARRLGFLAVAAHAARLQRGQVY